MTPRLLVADAAPGVSVSLDERQSHYLTAVLRLQPGAALEIFDGRGHRFAARLARGERRACVTDALVAIDSGGESPLALTLAQCLPLGDKMDWVVEKAVELGARRIVTLTARRSALRLDGARGERRHAHWTRIAEAACMQCGRDLLPEVTAPQPLQSWLQALGTPDSALRLALLPDAPKRLSQVAVAPDRDVLILVGPESGFSEEEHSAIITTGFMPVGLGPRVLRTETAGLAALAALQALAGDS